MTSKHTPGPWSVTKTWEAELSCIAEVGAYYITVPASRHNWASGEVELADARLIAAAPDLLAACVQAYGDVIEGNPIDIEKLNRAIAKAEGRQP